MMTVLCFLIICQISINFTLKGDSGGPLLQPSSTSGRYTVVGIVSAGVGCGSKDFAGLYTKVDVYMNWIKLVVR